MNELYVDRKEEEVIVPPKWDLRFLELAGLVAMWSKDPSTGVGAVITDRQHRVVSLGFNGFPRGIEDRPALLRSRDERLLRTIHAEENAILFADRQVDFCTMYVTHPPCANCTAKIIQVGIMNLVYRMPSEEFKNRWQDELNAAHRMLQEAGVRVRCF